MLDRVLEQLRLPVSLVEKQLYQKGILKVDQNLLPNFLCIGAQKSGTSWLHQNLKKHKEIFIPAKRDLHYFDEHFNQSLKAYAENFKGGEQLCKGEVMPGYGLLSRSKISFLKSIIPQLKLVFIMRNPIERAISHANMSYLVFHNKKSEALDAKDYIGHFKNKLSIQKGDYLRIINNWEAHYSRDQIAYHFFEEIENDPEQLLKSLFKYLGIRDEVKLDPDKLKLKINEGKKNTVPQEAMDFLISFYKNDIYALRDRFGIPIDAWIKKYYD